MSERKVFLEGRIAALKAEKESGVSMIRLEEIAQELSTHETELQQVIAQEEKDQQAAAQQVRIEEATAQAAYFLDNLVIEELTMRELCVGELQYQMLRIAVQNKIIDLAEEASKQISEVQAEEAVQQNALKKRIEELQEKVDSEQRDAFEDHELIKQLKNDLHQARIEVTDYQGKLKNATDEIDRLNSQVDDLRKEIAVGARNAYKVIDSEEQGKQLKELADQIKASRIHVYDVVPDKEINPANFTAINAKTGETVTYNWTQAKNYIEIKDPNEVEQFRQQFANKEAVSDSALGNEETPNVTPEVPFLELPTAQAPNIPGEIPVAVSAPESIGQVTREEFEALKLRVVELEKVCSVNEDTDSQAVA